MNSTIIKILYNNSVYLHQVNPLVEIQVNGTIIKFDGSIYNFPHYEKLNYSIQTDNPNKISIMINDNLFPIARTQKFIVYQNTIRYEHNVPTDEEEFLNILEKASLSKNILIGYKYFKNCNRQDLLPHVLNWFNNSRIFNKSYVYDIMTLKDFVDLLCKFFHIRANEVFNNHYSIRYYALQGLPFAMNQKLLEFDKEYLAQLIKIPELKDHIILYEIDANITIFTKILLMFINKYQNCTKLICNMTFEEIFHIIITYLTMKQAIQTTNITDLFGIYGIQGKFKPNVYITGFNEDTKHEHEFKKGEEEYIDFFASIPDFKVNVENYLMNNDIEQFIKSLLIFNYDNQDTIYISKDYTLNQFADETIEFCCKFGNFKFVPTNIINNMNLLMNRYRIGDFEPSCKFDGICNAELTPILNYIKYVSKNKFESAKLKYDEINTFEEKGNPIRFSINYCNYFINHLFYNYYIWDKNNCWIIDEIMIQILKLLSVLWCWNDNIYYNFIHIYPQEEFKENYTYLFMLPPNPSTNDLIKQMMILSTLAFIDIDEDCVDLHDLKKSDCSGKRHINAIKIFDKSKDLLLNDIIHNSNQFVEPVRDVIKLDNKFEIFDLSDVFDYQEKLIYEGTKLIQEDERRRQKEHEDDMKEYEELLEFMNHCYN